MKMRWIVWLPMVGVVVAAAIATFITRYKVETPVEVTAPAPVTKVLPLNVGVVDRRAAVFVEFKDCVFQAPVFGYTCTTALSQEWSGITGVLEGEFYDKMLFTQVDGRGFLEFYGCRVSIIPGEPVYDDEVYESWMCDLSNLSLNQERKRAPLPEDNVSNTAQEVPTS